MGVWRVLRANETGGFPHTEYVKRFNLRAEKVKRKEGESLRGILLVQEKANQL